MSSSLEFASIPESTLKVWISKDTTYAVDNEREEQAQFEQEDLISKSSRVTRSSDSGGIIQCPQAIDQERLCTIVDCDKCYDEEATKKPSEDQESNDNELTKIGGSIDVSQSVITPQSDEREKLSFSAKNEIKFGKEVQDEIVQYGVDHRSWKQAASKYCVSPRLVQSWAKRSGISLLEAKKSSTGMEGILQYGMKQRSWQEAAAKFDVPLYTVKFWARKAGYKLQKEKKKSEKRKVSTLRKLGMDKETILQFGIKQNSWKEAAVQFGLSLHSVQSLAKRAGYNLNIKKYSDDFKNTAVSFGETEGWRAAARKFGLGADRVREWAKKLGKKKRELVSNEEVKQEIIDYGDRVEQTNSKEAALKFGISEHTVTGKAVPELSKNKKVAAADADAELANKCDVCGLMPAVNMTLNEHELSRHLTVVGLCDVCGKDSEDFMEHFKIHHKIKSQESSLNMLGNAVKEEAMSVDGNQNSEDSVYSDGKDVKGETDERRKSFFFIC